MKHNTRKSRKGGYDIYDFTCEGCQSTGELQIPVEHKGQFGCPEKCGASYIAWDNPISGNRELMCVVCPVFADEKEDVS